MSTIERSISTQGSGKAGDWRTILVVVALVVGLAMGFGLGRTTTSTDPVVGPNFPAAGVHGIQGPGHVPRHWTDLAGTRAVGISSIASTPTGKDRR